MVTARERSKSVGRATPRPRGRTPSRSRSRSRVATGSKGSRTPASDSKVRGQRRQSSPSSSNASSGNSSRRSVTQKVEAASSGHKQKRSSFLNVSTPIRGSKGVIQTITAGRQQSAFITRSSNSVAPTGKPNAYYRFCEKFSTLFRETICPSSVLALLSLVLSVPSVLWLNLWLFAPAQSTVAETKGALPTTSLQGPAYQFAGVLWPTDWHFYFDYRCHLFVLLYLFINFLVARLIPFNHRLDGYHGPRLHGYKANGWVTLLLFGILYAVVQFGHFPQLHALRPSLLLPKYWLNLLVATGKIGSAAALVVYFASRHLPRSQAASEGNTGKFPVDLWVGRPLRPKWFGLDWKMVVLRPGIIGVLLADVTWLCVQWERYARVSPALTLLVVLHLIRVVDFLVFEYTIETSFKVRHEGFGYYAIVGGLIIPFVAGLGAPYMLAKPDLGNLFSPNGSPVYANWVTNSLAAVLFFTGLWINRSATNQKDLFRRQPNHPCFAGMTKLSGPHVQRLLAGGWWGLVRHPNYLGTLLMVYGVTLLSGFSSPIPWFHPLMVALVLVHRIWRTEYLNKEKYGSSWTTYTNLVPCKLIPGVY